MPGEPPNSMLSHPAVTPMSDRFRVLPQYLTPKLALTRFAGRQASRSHAFTQQTIRRFIAHYGVDMSEALSPDPASYATFNDFFTRALRPDVRPLADADLVCPVDGAISQFGLLQGDRIVQAKGHDYSARTLLGGEAGVAEPYVGGQFATIYLSPRDYHRVHMPCRARLRRMIHVPGSLFSVNAVTARGVRELFARNERVVCLFKTDAGPFALVLVGATIVGSMATVWHGVVNGERPGQLRSWTYDDREIVLDRGEEMGRFLLGSTVVLLFPPSSLVFNPQWEPGRSVRLGEPMADRVAAAPTDSARHEPV